MKVKNYIDSHSNTNYREHFLDNFGPYLFSIPKRYFFTILKLLFCKNVKIFKTNKFTAHSLHTKLLPIIYIFESVSKRYIFICLVILKFLGHLVFTLFRKYFDIFSYSPCMHWIISKSWNSTYGHTIWRPHWLQNMHDILIQSISEYIFPNFFCRKIATLSNSTNLVWERL